VRRVRRGPQDGQRRSEGKARDADPGNDHTG
jgi:hypothetical protein